MPVFRKPKESILEFFQKRKVVTLQELVKFSSCSSRTIERYLKLWRTHSSYNYNGCYYILPETPCFDSHGLWKVKDIGFSKHGNLKQTITYSLDHADTGFSAKELGHLLGVSVKEYLSIRFKTSEELNREKEDGHYLYFSSDPDIYTAQEQKRQELKQFQSQGQLPSEADAILILVELIKHPTDTQEQLTRRVRRRGITISIVQVRSLLQYHGLSKKILVTLRSKL